jgi:hypothetical protein
MPGGRDARRPRKPGGWDPEACREAGMLGCRESEEDGRPGGRGCRDGEDAGRLGRRGCRDAGRPRMPGGREAGMPGGQEAGMPRMPGCRGGQDAADDAGRPEGREAGMP